MPSLWNDQDHSAHPWIAGGRPHGAAPAPAPASSEDGESAERRFARPAVIAAVCVAAAIAGALAQVLL
ncbi:MAG: hypothetical protein QOC64_2626 [Solirubrobacteraceae bacterium]|jgi:hypothetical protein|nr:hypothetical protein [Solirubrobacteraceae bacterium]